MKRFYNDYIKDNLMFWIFAIVSILLLITSFLLPPTGVINPSVLEAVAELFAFSALGAVYKAINKGTTASVTHGSTTLTVGDREEE